MESIDAGVLHPDIADDAIALAERADECLVTQANHRVRMYTLLPAGFHVDLYPSMFLPMNVTGRRIDSVRQVTVNSMPTDSTPIALDGLHVDSFVALHMDGVSISAHLKQADLMVTLGDLVGAIRPLSGVDVAKILNNITV